MTVPPRLVVELSVDRRSAEVVALELGRLVQQYRVPLTISVRTARAATRA